MYTHTRETLEASQYIAEMKIVLVTYTPIESE